MGLPVRTTAYPPRYRLSYDLAGTICQLAPDRAWLKIEDREQFAELYKAKAELELGPFPYLRLEEIAHEIRVRSGRRRARLVLLCFCDISKTWCHRQILAGWLDNAGIECPELTPKETT
jgi:hypothetical protein